MGVRVPADHGEVIYKLRCDGDAEDMLVTLGVAELAGTSFDQVIADSLYDAFSVTMQKVVSASYLFAGLTLRVGPDSTGPVFEVVGTRRGLEPGVPCPPNCAILIGKATGLGGRRNRGRAYIPGVVEASVDAAGAIAPPYLGAIQAQAELWRAETAAIAGVSEVVLFHTTAPGFPAIAPTVVTQHNARAKIATQRRRLRP